MNLIRLIENLSLNENLPEIIYDKNGRYEKTYRNQSINNNIQQRTTTDSPRTSIDERYFSIANQFNLSSLFIEKQYELALKNRIEIPPILMHKILNDAIGILHLIINEFDENQEKYQRILKHLIKLENYNKLFHQHC